MRKAILMMLLGVMSSSAAAGWVEISRSDDADMTTYADPATHRKKGNRMKMWTLFDYKTAQVVSGDKPYLSQKAQKEYDCKEEQSRTLVLTSHSGNMGGGEVVYSNYNVNGNWEPVAPESIVEDMWKFACGKK
jgi:hypothetical protein